MFQHTSEYENKGTPMSNKCCLNSDAYLPLAEGVIYACITVQAYLHYSYITATLRLHCITATLRLHS
jgi:hypothetical protein